jgi:hypothetical protein
MAWPTRCAGEHTSAPAEVSFCLPSGQVFNATHTPSGPNSLGSNTLVCSRTHSQAHSYKSAAKPPAQSNSLSSRAVLRRPELASR